MEIIYYAKYLFVRDVAHHYAYFGAVFEFGDVFCFTDFLSGFLYRVRGRVRVKVRDGGWF